MVIKEVVVGSQVKKMHDCHCHVLRQNQEGRNRSRLGLKLNPGHSWKFPVLSVQVTSGF